MDNRDGNYATWAAVGNNYHNLFNFGALVAKDFAAWRQEELNAWEALRQKLSADAEKLGLAFADRLDRTAKFSQSLPAPTAGARLDWQAITRIYAQMNFVDAVYRGMEAEIAYARMLSSTNP